MIFTVPFTQQAEREEARRDDGEFLLAAASGEAYAAGIFELAGVNPAMARLLLEWKCFVHLSRHVRTASSPASKRLSILKIPQINPDMFLEL